MHHDTLDRDTFTTRTLARVALLMLVPLLASPAAAAPKVVTYNVSGTTVDELIKSLNASPVGGWGYTEHLWHVSYNTGTKPTNIKVTTTVTVTMPKWPGYNSASTCLKTSWNGMYNSLRAHEDRHVALGVGVDAKIKDAVAAVAVSDASELKAAVDAAIAGVQAANKVIQDKFDTDTDNGKADPADPVRFAPCP